MFKKSKAVDQVDDVTFNAPFYLRNASVNDVKVHLDGQPDGSFVIRDSVSQPGNFQLSYMLGGAVKNVHIEGSKDGVHFAKSVLKFVCLTELVRNYCEQENGDIACLLTTQVNLGPVIDGKTLKKQIKNRGKGGGPGGPGGGAAGGDWRVADVCTWLKKEGMGEYASSFQKNNIDGPALLALDENDLKDLGVAKVGDRRKLEKAIADLNQHLNGGGPPPGGGGPPQGGGAPQGGAGPSPVATVGLVARNVGGQVKIFDIDTGEEVHDIAEHQQRKEARKAAAAQQAPPPRPAPAAAPAAAPPPAAAASGGGGGGDFQNEYWYDQALAKGDIAGRLQGWPNGTFVVRDSASSPGSFGLSYMFNGSVAGKLIQPSGDGGFQLKGAPKAFPTMAACMDYYVNNSSGALKCKLVYPSQGSPPAQAAPPPAAAGMPVWNCLTNTKEQALAKIKGKPAGAFVIRPSDKAFAAISMVKVDGTSMFHQHIEEGPQGLCLKKSTMHTADLDAFVAHYCSGAQTDLPCPLIDNY